MMLREVKRMPCRYCGKEIILVKTARGKSVPVDPQSKWYREDPNGAAFIRMDGEVVRGSSCYKTDDRCAGIGYLNHDATCADSRRRDRCRGKKLGREERRNRESSRVTK